MRAVTAVMATVALGLATGCATPPAPAAAGTAPAAAAPAAKAAAPAGVSLVNPGYESQLAGPRGDPQGWFTFQHAGDKSYQFVLDPADARGGARSLRIENTGPEPYGAVAQAMDAATYVGKVARLSAWMRTRDVNETGAVLTILVLRNGVPLDHNFMADKPAKGTTPWTRYTITLPVARGAERIEVGAMLQGKGVLWLDDVELEFVDP